MRKEDKGEVGSRFFFTSHLMCNLGEAVGAIPMQSSAPLIPVGSGAAGPLPKGA